MEAKTEGRASKIFILIARILVIVMIVAVLIMIFARCYFRIPVKDYYGASEKMFIIPDLNNGFIPQGICKADNDEILVTGYLNNEPCPIYRVDSNGDTVGCVYLNNQDGSDFICHAGGIAFHGDYVYIAGGENRCLYVFDYADICNAEYGDELDCIGRVELTVSDDDYLTAACVTSDDSSIYIAEFYREENYPTLDSHKLVTKAGNHNNALAVRFDFSDDEDSKFGVSANAKAVYSIPDKIQGICVKDDVIYMSSSYAAAFSDIYKFDLRKAKSDNKKEVLGVECDLYELDSASLMNKYKIAPMAEEIEIIGDNMYVMCESASNKYIFGKMTAAEYCYGTKMSFFN